MDQNNYNRYFIELVYNGTSYHGWQIQQNALTVQELVDRALSTLCRNPVLTTGCGRTDTGVHAKQLYAHFDLPHGVILPSAFLNGLNALLPHDIAVKGVWPVSPEAHARFDAVRRSYEYHVHIGKDPFLKEFSWQLKEIPDIESMNCAAKILFEYTDFSCFSKSNTQVFTNNCTIMEAYWAQKQDDTEQRLTFHITADRFLRNMVRAIVGTLMEIGQGKQDIDYMRKVIESKNRSHAGMSVPAKGLFLTSVVYPEDLFDTKTS